MPTNRELEIIMKLKDEVSKRLSGIEGGLRKFANTAKEVGSNLRQLGRAISQIGATITFMGAAITGPLLLAFKNAEKYSIPVHNQMERLKNVTLAFQVSIANALVPVIEKLTNFLGRLLNIWNSLSPAMQETIIQGAFLTGVFLTVGGAVTILIGKLISLGGNILKVIGIFMSFLSVHPVLLVVGVAIGVLIALMFRFKNVADAVLNTLQVGFNTLAIGFHKVAAFIIGMLEKLLTFLEDISGALSIIASKFNKEFSKSLENVSKNLKNMRDNLDEVRQASDLTVKDLETDVTKIFETGEGSWAEGFNKIKDMINKISEMMKDTGKTAIPVMTEAFNFMEEMARGTAQAMTQAFGSLFFNVFKGQFDNLKDVFADFGNQILQVLSQAIARMILMKTIGAMFPGLGKFFHQGGIIKAHRGYLASDEVPIIAQAGEGVISRKGMSALGADNLARLNRGQSLRGGNVTYNPVVVIQAWDTRDVARNSKMIESIIGDAVSRNSKRVRDPLMRYT